MPLIKMDYPAIPLTPPGNLQKQWGHHWIQYVDTDGRSQEQIVLCWEPSVQRWCQSGVGASENGFELAAANYRYLIPCDAPDIENDLSILQNRIRQKCTQLRKTLELGEAFSPEQEALIRELLILHGNPI